MNSDEDSDISISKKTPDDDDDEDYVPTTSSSSQILSTTFDKKLSDRCVIITRDTRPAPHPTTRSQTRQIHEIAANVKLRWKYCITGHGKAVLEALAFDRDHLKHVPLMNKSEAQQWVACSEDLRRLLTLLTDIVEWSHAVNLQDILPGTYREDLLCIIEIVSFLRIHPMPFEIVTENSKTWKCTAVTLWIIILACLLIIHHPHNNTNRPFISVPAESLVRGCFIAIDPKKSIHLYTQKQCLLALRCMAYHWKRLEQQHVRDAAVYLKNIEIRLATICLCSGDASIYDITRMRKPTAAPTGAQPEATHTFDVSFATAATMSSSSMLLHQAEYCSTDIYIMECEETLRHMYKETAFFFWMSSLFQPVPQHIVIRGSLAEMWEEIAAEKSLLSAGCLRIEEELWNASAEPGLVNAFYRSEIQQTASLRMIVMENAKSDTQKLIQHNEYHSTNMLIALESAKYLQCQFTDELSTYNHWQAKGVPDRQLPVPEDILQSSALDLIHRIRHFPLPKWKISIARRIALYIVMERITMCPTFCDRFVMHMRNENNKMSLEKCWNSLANNTTQEPIIVWAAGDTCCVYFYNVDELPSTQHIRKVSHAQIKRCFYQTHTEHAAALLWLYFMNTYFCSDDITDHMCMEKYGYSARTIKKYALKIFSN